VNERSSEELRGLFESRLRPKIEALDGRRRQVRNTIIGGVAVALLGVGSCITAFDPPSELTQSSLGRFAPFGAGLVALVFFGVALARFLVPGMSAYLSLRARFKKDVVTELVRALAPGVRYFPDRSLTREAFDASGLFRTSLGRFTGDDLLRGTCGETPWEACEIQASYTTGTGKSSKTRTVLKGLFLRIDFDRELAGRTLVQPAKAPGWQLGEREHLVRVELRDAGFAEAFAVWATSQQDAEALFEGGLADRLLALHEELGRPLHLSFSGREVFAAVDLERPLFEPRIARSLDLAAVTTMARDLGIADAIVRALGLEHGRRLPPDPAFHDGVVKVGELEAVSGDGEVTFAEIAEAASAAEQGPAGEPVAPPMRPWAQVESLGGETVVRYPGSVGLFLLLLSYVGGALVTATLALNWASPAWSARIREALASRLSSDSPPVAALGEAPTALLVVSLLVWLFLGAWLRHRPARVDVGMDGVRIRRVFRPWSVRIPLGAIAKAQASGTQVHLIRSDRSFLRSFVQASPLLPSPEEARWIAATLENGMRQLGWRRSTKGRFGV
jgi:hypothetical protein